MISSFETLQFVESKSRSVNILQVSSMDRIKPMRNFQIFVYCIVTALISVVIFLWKIFERTRNM